MEEADEQINDDVAVLLLLEDQSLITAKVPASESELSSNDQVVSMENGEINNAVTQFVGDNIHLNIVSIHDKPPFHSLGWIKVTSPASSLPDPQTTAAVPRLKLKSFDKGKILRGGEVKIIPFTIRKEIGTNAIMFLSLAELSSSLAHDQPLLTPGDTLWAAGWVIKSNDSEFPHSNWNGGMKRIHNNDAKQSTQIEFLPVIEGDPNDLDTIFTTLKECIRITGFAIVTVDFPIWLEAVNIIKQANLLIIARLDGFHLLKSYLGSMGNKILDY